MDTCKVYKMVYDDKTRGENGNEGFLGEFEVIQVIAEDGWKFDFIGRNIETNQICIITSTEICGYGSGMASYVTVLENMRLVNTDPVFDTWDEKDLGDLLWAHIVHCGGVIVEFCSCFDYGNIVTLYKHDGSKVKLKKLPEANIVFDTETDMHYIELKDLFDILKNDCESFVDQAGNRIYLNPLFLFIIPFIMKMEDGNITGINPIYYNQCSFIASALERLYPTKKDLSELLTRADKLWIKKYKKEG